MAMPPKHPKPSEQRMRGDQAVLVEELMKIGGIIAI